MATIILHDESSLLIEDSFEDVKESLSAAAPYPADKSFLEATMSADPKKRIMVRIDQIVCVYE